MKSFAFISLAIFCQLFFAVESRAIDKEISVVYTFGDELEKYKKVEDTKWDKEIDDEIEVPENNIFKRMVFEDDDEDFQAKLKEFENVEDDEVVDEVPNEFPHEDERLLKRGSISSSEYFRSQLSAFERRIYDQLNTISKPGTIKKLDFELKNLKSSNIKTDKIQNYSSRGIGALVRDHPEYWWIKKYNIKMTQTSDRKYVTAIKVTIHSDYTVANINKFKTKIRNKAVSIANAAKKKNNTYNRLLYIHDYLVKYISYKDGQTYSYNLYGALYKNSSACEGYAEAFAFIARLISVPVICVTSNSHKWNYVYLKSKWFVVDVTFDDPSVNGKVYASGETKNLSHKFFLIGKNTKIKGNKTYTTYSNRKLVSYLEFPNATGFKFPTLSNTAYTQ
ncbi:hypothetical protein PIROE2DRAFT_62358 [Piromyces sp. E2]|nr:hypothetical protein PIROE2DRAFT_62358 [Piromyces sp. E2]|eukprot:OUM61673.1 hypothetical protein PIROE2DRAFT_62358 [Piromyces sp. E2]